MPASRGRTAPIRVLWLAKGLGPGGMERLLEMHARVGDRDAFTYSAAYLVERPNSVVPSLEALGVPCTHLVGAHDLDPRWARQLRDLVRRDGIDVVHVHSPMVASVTRPALRLMRRRPGLVYTEHNSWDCYSAPTRLANALTYVLDDAQLAVSAPAATSAPAFLRRGIENLTHGIDLDAVAAHAVERERVRAELGIEPGTTVIITVAHLRKEKGYDVLLDAAHRVLERRSDVVFVTVGQGPEHDDLIARHEQLGLGDRFRFLGFRSDVPDLLAAADVCCFSSRHEGLPVALMEASAMSLPTVATRVGGLPDVIEDDGSGLLVDPDDPAQLAAALMALVDDPQRRRRLGERARELAARFDACAAVARLESVYREVAR